MSDSASTASTEPIRRTKSHDVTTTTTTPTTATATTTSTTPTEDAQEEVPVVATSQVPEAVVKSTVADTSNSAEEEEATVPESPPASAAAPLETVDLERSSQVVLNDQQPQMMPQANLNSSITSVNSTRSGNRSFSAFPPIRLTRSIQNSNWRENLSNNLTSVIQEFRPVFQPHNNANSSSNNRGIIANLSNYRIPSNSSFRYIDSPASDTANPPNYASDSFVINFDNHAQGYRSTTRPSLTDSYRPEHTHNLHGSVRSDAGDDPNESGGGGVAGSGATDPPREPPPHEHNEANLSETIAQIPEAASLLDTLSRYVPYVCILLAKSCYDHLDGILDFFALFVTFYHANKVVRQEVTKQNQRSLLNLLRALCFILVVVAVIGFMLDKKNIPITMLITGSLAEPFTLKSLMFAIGINDLILKLFTVAVKIVITLIPPAFIDYKGRGRIYLMTEAISQFLRSLVTTHPWLLFLLDSYQGTEKIMGVILSGAYIVAKGSDLLQRIKFCKQAFLKLLQKVCIGVIPTKEQIQQAGGLCTICHDNFNAPAMLDCGHIFCELCIGTWLDRATVCPLCRAKISDDPSFRDGSTTFFIQLY